MTEQKMIDLQEALHADGFLLRGGLYPGAEDRLPSLPGDRSVATLLLVGNAGPGFWQRFAEDADRSRAEPMDHWSRERLTEVAGRFEVGVIFPFDGPPWYPFQRWALRADQAWQSPLGLLLHARYGLWHAYRGALLLAEKIALPSAADAGPSPCLSCVGQPCLHTCPVEAFSPAGYDVSACRQWLAGAGNDCLTASCAARRACPVGGKYRYEPAQAEFHMRAFLDAPLD